jgi:hypothetical protein
MAESTSHRFPSTETRRYAGVKQTAQAAAHGSDTGVAAAGCFA